MLKSTSIALKISMDEVLNDISVLKSKPGLSDLVDAYLSGDYKAILTTGVAQALFRQSLERLPKRGKIKPSNTPWNIGQCYVSNSQALLIGLTAFNAFLQANVTGPPMQARSLLFSASASVQEVSACREKCFASLDMDGLSVYQYIPHVELFSLARSIFTDYFPRVSNGQTKDSRWMRIRINAYHQRLLSSGTSNVRLIDSAAWLQTQIDADMFTLENEMMGTNSTFSTETKVQFLLEKAQIYIMQGLDIRARENIKMARKASQFSYALSGALGKRTRFQEKDISQLVVFAKSNSIDDKATETTETTETTQTNDLEEESTFENRVSKTGPEALQLNDDTLLENIEFTKLPIDKVNNSALPADLVDLQPDQQPQLEPLDQIILLTEATLKDALSPLDKLNSEEILPYAVRVLADKPTNWQVYTQALLVRSRIESHRSRTQERSVLQLQVIVDQIIAETQQDPSLNNETSVPDIQVTQWLPKLKPSESAPVMERLKFIFQLNTPTRWEVETELAYAWSRAGSLVSALEIFKRLKLWAEASLCYHSVGQEDKARQIVRRQLYYSSKGPLMDQYDIDAAESITEKWNGEIRTPPPAHSPRLWCILGDLDQDPECWERAWEISKKRYGRAQRTLGEYYTQKGDLVKARECYMAATAVNRQNGDTWSRLGDIDLRVGNWDGAIIAFQQSIMVDDSDAKTYSNLGSALLSKYSELISLQKSQPPLYPSSLTTSAEPRGSPKAILHQALIAYKRGASLAHSNWQIWDNVITIAGRTSPPSFPDILLALRAVIRIRAPSIGEAAVDVTILRALVAEITSSERYTPNMAGVSVVYVPPRGSLPRAVMEMVETEVVPLITGRAVLWTLVEKLRLYCRDFRGALDCAEKAWRVVTGGDEWVDDEAGWKDVMAQTDALVSAYENYGPREGADGEEVERGWRGKARSAIRGVMGKARENWDESDEFGLLKGRLDDLKSS